MHVGTCSNVTRTLSLQGRLPASLGRFRATGLCKAHPGAARVSTGGLLLLAITYNLGSSVHPACIVFDLLGAVVPLALRGLLLGAVLGGALPRVDTLLLAHALLLISLLQLYIALRGVNTLFELGDDAGRTLSAPLALA